MPATAAQTAVWPVHKATLLHPLKALLQLPIVVVLVAKKA
jgi:hypothetical protein